MKKIHQIDENGLYICDIIVDDNSEIPKNCISTVCPNGFYLPKWNGIEWVEGGEKPQPSIDYQISELKDKLASEDYKIIKCYEYKLNGQDMPYDIDALHEERELIRQEIRILQELKVNE